MNLSRMLAPKSAVFIGGEDLLPIIENAQKHQFSGDIFIVNQSQKSMAGIQCFSSIEELPVDPDVAYVSLARDLLPSVLQSLYYKQCGGVVINSPQLTDTDVPDIVYRGDDLPILGGNAAGFANYLDHSIFLQSQQKTHEPIETGVAVVSADQTFLNEIDYSGSGLSVAYSIVPGGETGLSEAELLDYILTDDRVSAVLMLLDDVRNVTALSIAALKAARKGVPIVAVKAGKSVADDYLAVSALFARLGFIECATPAEAAETLKMLIGTSRPLGRRAAIVVNSPAYAKISTDAARKAKLEVKELEPSITSYLKPFLTDNLTATNPLVLEIKQDAQAIGLSDVYRPFLSDKHDLAIFVGSIPKDKSAADQLLQFLELFADEALAQNLPCAFINTSSYLIPSSIEQSLLKRNVAILNGLEHGMRAVVKSVEFVEQMILMAQMPTGAIQLPEPSNLLPTIQLDEFDSKLVLRQIGVQIPNSILVEGTISLDLNEMVYPVVLKAVSSKMSRKTDVGALKLDLLTETQVRQAIFEMNAQVEALQLRGYLVEEMVIDGIAELYVGISNIPEIGLVLTLASGGILVELLQDVQTLILPASSAEIEATLRKLRLFPVLEGYRGHSAADVDLVVESISLMASHAASQQHRLVGLEVNPLIVRPGDRSPVAVDAVIRLGATLQ